MRTVRLSISYGHDIHYIQLDEKTYAAISSGQKIKLDGQGFSHEEDGTVLDHWVFNREPGEIYFWLDSGAEFHAHDSWIEDV